MAGHPGLQTDSEITVAWIKDAQSHWISWLPYRCMHGPYRKSIATHCCHQYSVPAHQRLRLGVSVHDDGPLDEVDHTLGAAGPPFPEQLRPELLHERHQDRSGDGPLGVDTPHNAPPLQDAPLLPGRPARHRDPRDLLTETLLRSLLLLELQHPRRLHRIPPISGRVLLHDKNYWEYGRGLDVRVWRGKTGKF